MLRQAGEGKCRSVMKAMTIGAGLVLALALSAPATAHKDHREKAAAAAAKAADQHAGMDHGAASPVAVAAPASPAVGTVEIGEHGERRDLVRDEPFFVRLLDWLGRFHTAVVHFPVGLTLGAVIAEIVGRRRDAAPWRAAARIMLVIAAVGGIVAAALGWINAGFVMIDTDGVLTWHRWIGTALALLGVALAWAATGSGRDSGRPRSLYWLLLGVTSIGVAIQGYLGGALVHGGLDHLAF